VGSDKMELIKETFYDEKMYKYTKDDDFASLLIQLTSIGYKLNENYKVVEDDETLDYHAVFVKETNIYPPNTDTEG
jgi:hypothetical protein